MEENIKKLEKYCMLLEKDEKRKAKTIKYLEGINFDYEFKQDEIINNINFQNNTSLKSEVIACIIRFLIITILILVIPSIVLTLKSGYLMYLLTGISLSVGVSGLSGIISGTLYKTYTKEMDINSSHIEDYAVKIQMNKDRIKYYEQIIKKNRVYRNLINNVLEEIRNNNLLEYINLEELEKEVNYTINQPINNSEEIKEYILKMTNQ